LASGARMLITGGTVVKTAADGGVVTDGAVAIEGNRIAAVGPSEEMPSRFEAAPRIDASGKIVMPGLINAHTHLYSSLARGITADISASSNFVEILEHMWWRLDRALSDEDVWCSAAVGAIDLIRHGTTTIIDHHASQVAVTDSLWNVAEALTDVGIRANLCFEVSDRGGPVKRDEGLVENERFARWIAAGREESSIMSEAGIEGASAYAGSMMGASVGLHASFTLDDGTLERAASIASDESIGCHIHVAEDEADVRNSLERCGKRVVERLESFGILGEKSIAAHCNHVDENEIEILRGTKTIVAHNPQSNMNNAVGCADVPHLLDEGVIVGLGTDGFTASMFDEMKVANLIHRHNAGDRTVGHDVAARLCLSNNPKIASTLFDDRVGSIEPGVLADVIVLGYDPPTPLTGDNFVGHLIFGLTGWMVETVIINGGVVMRDREFTGIDVDGIMSRARERARDLWARM
jgi:putative selenium metabolism protein SsnA